MSPGKKKKIQGPGTAMRFWGLVWSDKTCVVPEAVVDHGQAYPTSKSMKEAPFSLCRDLGELLFPICLLYHLVRCGSGIRTVSCL